MSEKTDWTGLKHGLFADRGTDINKALEYAHGIIGAIPSEGGSRMAAFTALHVVLNTVANRIIEEIDGQTP